MILFTDCSNRSGKNNQVIIDTTVVLSIGKVNITGYEFAKNLNMAKAQLSQNGEAMQQNVTLNTWKNDYINKIYLLADAYDKGYNENVHVDSIVNNAARFMVSQPHGLLDLEKSKNYQVSAEELNEAIERSKNSIHIEYIKFKDRDQLMKKLPRGIAPINANFEKLLSTINLSDVEYKKDVLVWPFAGYWGKENEIYDLKEGETSPILKINNGYYLIHVKTITRIRSPISQTNAMKARLQFTYEQKASALYRDSVFRQAQPKVNNDTIAAFAQKIYHYNYLKGHNFRKADLSEILSKNIISYLSPARQNRFVTVANFIDNYNTLPFKADIKSPNDIVNSLYAMVVNDYAYTDALKLGITRQPQFLLDRNNFKNNIIFNLYTSDVLDDKTAVTDDEIVKAYNLNRSNYKQPVNVVVSLYYFNNRPDAVRANFNVKSDTMKFAGLIKKDLHQTINYKTKMFPDELKRELFSMKNKGISKVFEWNGKFIVAAQEGEKGSRLRSLDEVRDLVIEEIKKQRVVSNQKTRLDELKRMYKPKIDLTDSTFPNIAAN